MISCTLYDVAVIGGGPAGSSAAWWLAAGGMRTAVFEKAEVPRYKTCGGGVVQRALHSLPFSLDGTIHHACTSAELHCRDADLHFIVRRDDAIITMVMRDEFDTKLLSESQKAGAELIPHCEVLDIQQERNRVKLKTARGEFAARFLIAADGVTGTAARKSGWNMTHAVVPALEYEVSASKNLMSRFSHTARFDFDIVPQGYAWVFPKTDHLSIGVLTTDRHAANLNEFIGKYMDLIGVECGAHADRHGYIIPLHPRSDGFVRHRALLAGDAAGFVDPVTCEGITFALRSGKLAAKAIIEGNNNAARVGEIYVKSLHADLLSELRWGKFLAKILYDRRMRNRLFRTCGQQLAEIITDVMMGTRTYRDVISDPANYRKFLTLLFRRST